MTGKGFEHVIKESDARSNRDRPLGIEIDGNANIGFPGLALHRRAPRLIQYLAGNRFPRQAAVLAIPVGDAEACDTDISRELQV